ncbi:hypothetical protein GW17_00023656 [Ensete ventricosum]|nr:hypothetical protein GW17_00023656 [Ensete ventricosum]
MASENHTDKNAVFKKLKSKSENKVTEIGWALGIWEWVSRSSNSDYGSFFLSFFLRRCASIATRRTPPGRR